MCPGQFTSASIRGKESIPYTRLLVRNLKKKRKTNLCRILHFTKIERFLLLKKFAKIKKDPKSGVVRGVSVLYGSCHFRISRLNRTGQNRIVGLRQFRGWSTSFSQPVCAVLTLLRALENYGKAQSMSRKCQRVQEPKWSRIHPFSRHVNTRPKQVGINSVVLTL